MKYESKIQLKNGQECIIRSGTFADGAEALELFLQARRETDFLLTYPEENRFDAKAEGEFLQGQSDSPNEAELLAVAEGKIVATAGISAVGRALKVKHRAEFGINVAKEAWGLGIGRALTLACIECARAAGYGQLELEVVADNMRAIALYKSVGFVEYGRNPMGFLSKYSGTQELVYMRLAL